LNASEFSTLLDKIQSEEREVRECGQAEYAHDSSNAFSNFVRVANHLGITKEQVLLTYALKHLDGIVSYVKGHRSQREDVRGRIKDLRMYLAILWGMIEESDPIPDGMSRARKEETLFSTK
jgi:hypothetical protein